MAAEIPSFLIADGKNNLGGLLAYEGIVDVRIRRVDNEYAIDGDGVGIRRIVREIQFTYRPPVSGGAQDFLPINWYDWLDKDVTVQFAWKTGGSVVTRTYAHMIMIEVLLHKYYDTTAMAARDEMIILLRMPQPELDLARQARL